MVDDDADSLKLYSGLLQHHVKSTIVTTSFPEAAFQLAQARFFDFILIDVSMNYNDSQFGGFELYKHLLPRYGAHSLVLYSRYVNQDLLKRYGYDFNFVEWQKNPVAFSREISSRAARLRDQQTCFVAMPFSSSYERLYSEIKAAVVRCGYDCIRVDEQNFTRSIMQKMFDEIARAKIIIFVATDQNPNAFYEAGYAEALHKEVITVTDKYSSLPFDIRHRNAIAYKRNPAKVLALLVAMMRGLCDGTNT